MRGKTPSWRDTADRDRIAALRAYGVLNTAPEPELDDIVALAARLCGTPTAVISLVDADRQWFKARVGLDVQETERSLSFCDHAIRGAGVMTVEDATADARFSDNSLVTGTPHIRFYAGAPLVGSDGHALGALAVIDSRPRPGGLTDLQEQTLSVLARQVMTQLELRRALAAQQRSEDSVRRAVEASQYVGAWDWDLVSDTLHADERFAQMFGVEPEVARRGAPREVFAGVVIPEDQPRVSEQTAAAMAALGTFESEYRIRVDGQLRWVLARGQVYGDESGQPVRFPGVIIDITARKAVEEALARTVEALGESEARFRAIADSMPQMVWSTRPDGFHDYYNARWYEFTGVPAGSTDGEGWNDMFHPGDQERARILWRHSLETGDPYEIEYRLRHRSGVYRWTLGRARPIRDESGEIIRWFGTCTDIDDLKRMEQAKELLSQELSHRIKNIFAVVSALIALSARQFPEAKAFAAAVRTRINALARAHEFVRPHTETSQPTVGSMTLHAFLDSLFRPYADGAGGARVILSGEDAVFDDQAATSVALLFHELATNAAKYGALSVEGGRVVLHTRREGDRFILVWEEQGGPPVTPPEGKGGFGSSLATLSVEGQLGGRLRRDWRPEGLRIEADLPATALARRRAALNVG